MVTVLAVVTVAFAAQDDGGGLGQAKVTLCHKGHTMTVDAPTLAAHRRHLDTEGACPPDTETPARTEHTTRDTAADAKGDEIANGATHDVMNGLPAGADVYGASAADTLHGTPYTDFLQGGRGPDRMFGGGGKDYIDGVDGIAGTDTLNGSLGTDHCVGDKDDTFKGCEGNVVAVPVPSATPAPTEAGH